MLYAEWKKGSDLLVELVDFIDAIDNSDIEGATVAFNIYDDLDDALIAGPVSMPTPGGGEPANLYRGVAPDTTSLELGQRLKIVVVGDGGANLKLPLTGRIVVIE